MIRRTISRRLRSQRRTGTVVPENRPVHRRSRGSVSSGIVDGNTTSMAECPDSSMGFSPAPGVSSPPIQHPALRSQRSNSVRSPSSRKAASEGFADRVSRLGRTILRAALAPPCPKTCSFWSPKNAAFSKLRAFDSCLSKNFSFFQTLERRATLRSFEGNSLHSERPSRVPSLLSEAPRADSTFGRSRSRNFRSPRKRCRTPDGDREL